MNILKHNEYENNSGNKKVIRNYTYNMLYEVFLLIIPILVTPYIARVLGEDGSGQFSYTYSINSYFVLFASLGFTFYAQRLIASHQGNKHQQSIDFWEIFIIRLIPSFLTMVVYLTTIVLDIYGERYNQLMLILSINIIAVVLDINFFFQGNEEFDKIVFRNIIIKTISIACIFVFVKEQSDLWKYALIQSGSILGSNTVLWVYMHRYLIKISKQELHPIKHLKPVIVLFIPTIALSVYTVLDRTLIGIITKLDSENGNYEYAEKLVKMFLTILTSLATVLSPRNAKKYAEGDIRGVEKNIYQTCRFVFFIGIPLMFGIIATADNLIPWYLGPGYDKAANLMKLLSPLVIFIGLSNVFGRQYLIPSNQDNKFTIAIIYGAITNLILNILLISKFASYGAAIATVIAEFVVAFVMCLFIKNNIHFKIVIVDSWRYWLSGAIMFIICYYVQGYLSPSILHTFLIVLLGVITYTLFVFICKDPFVLNVLHMFKEREKNG